MFFHTSKNLYVDKTPVTDKKIEAAVINYLDM